MARRIDFLPTGYKIIQDDRFFKLGQDSIMLSKFAKIPKNAKICDLGCGTGVISMLLLGLDSSYKVTGIELQKEVYELAVENVEINKLNERFTLINGDIREMKTLLEANTMDYVISNPPYFAVGSGKQSSSEHKKIARQDDNLSLSELISAASYILKFGGKFALVHRPERLCDIILLMKENKIEPKRLCFVQSDINIKPSAVLIEGRYGSKSGIEVLPPILIKEERNG